MKLARIVDPLFQLALNKLASADLPIRTAWKLKGIAKQVGDEFAKYEDLRKAALQKYGKKKENGTLDLGEKGDVKFEGTGLQDFAKELGELANIEVDVPTIRLADLGEKINMSTADLLQLDGLLEE